MKKNALIFLLIFAGYSALAQDTVYRFYPDSKYFNILTEDSSDLEFQAPCVFGSQGKFMGMEYISKDSITIYGIAVCPRRDSSMYYDPDDPYSDFQHIIYDKTLDSVFEFFSIYKQESVPTLASELLKLHLRDTPISYYWNMGIETGSYPRRQLYLATYELYFENAITLAGTFYVGCTGNCAKPFIDSTGEWYPNKRYPISIRTVGAKNYYLLRNYTSHNETSDSWSYFTTVGHTMIFPIISPPDNLGNDTTGIIDDTLSISNPSPLDRFVITKPNPASTSVQVASSVGLVSIMATDMNGREVYKTTASGMSHMINVSEWEPGLYIFTIKTPMGEIKKKVLVQ